MSDERKKLKERVVTREELEKVQEDVLRLSERYLKLICEKKELEERLEELSYKIDYLRDMYAELAEFLEDTMRAIKYGAESFYHSFQSLKYPHEKLQKIVAFEHERKRKEKIKEEEAKSKSR